MMVPANNLGLINDPAGRHLVCLEVNPPRGTEMGDIFRRLDGGLEGIDFLNVTDSALARMKLAAFPFATTLKARYGIEPMVNISCRDRNLIAIQADLLGAWSTGIRSVVALTGDAVSIGDDPERKGVFEVNSIGLINAINTLNAGKDLAGNSLNGAPDFVVGVVVNPNANNPAAEIKRLQKKKDAGAKYALSQPVFDQELASTFFKEASKVGVPLFMGLLPLKNGKAARAVISIPGIKLSAALQQVIAADPDADLSSFSIEHSLKLAESNREYVRGYHVISGASAKLALQLGQELAKYVRSTPR
ncbi:MAG: methylenetetrahydrofolate reductase [Oligoflexia bacterium]|nr:methylenetetrahydrofolate reductase [Oligoflexia bacterium]